MGRKLCLWDERRIAFPGNHWSESSARVPARSELAALRAECGRRLWRVRALLLRHGAQGQREKFSVPNGVGPNRTACRGRAERSRRRARRGLAHRTPERRWHLGRGRIYGHRFPVRFLFEVSLVSDFVPALRAGALRQHAQRPAARYSRADSRGRDPASRWVLGVMDESSFTAEAERGVPHSMTTLVTGATGFVGSHVARQLVIAGHSVRILVRKSSNLQAL